MAGEPGGGNRDQLARRQKGAYTVQIKVRRSDFITPTRQITRPDPVNQAQDIYATSYLLLQHTNYWADLSR